MNSDKLALLLIGSPRGKKSTSHSLGSYLLDLLGAKGMETQNMNIQMSLKTEEGKKKLLFLTDRSDIIILAFPLYVDTLPAPVIEMMELIRDHVGQDEKENGENENEEDNGKEREKGEGDDSSG